MFKFSSFVLSMKSDAQVIFSSSLNNETCGSWVSKLVINYHMLPSNTWYQITQA